ncbi:hypothetical protein ACKWTF_014489 [Chironomus riparius]
MKVAVVLCILIVAAVATPEDPCDDGCPRIQAPVCGYNTEPEDGETFSNMCVLEYFACKRGTTFTNIIHGLCPGNKIEISN